MKLGPYELGPYTNSAGVYTGDARELAQAIPDQSVDLIFADPVYSERVLYDWLGCEAQRILRPAGALLVYSNGKWQYQNTKWIEATGLHYRYTLSDILLAKSSPLCGKIIAKTTRIIWFDIDGHSRLLNHIVDGHIATSGTSGKSGVVHGVAIDRARWPKGMQMMRVMLEGLCQRDGIIFDPFTGTGTLPAVCKVSGYNNCLAFEKDPELAEIARRRIHDTQPPLFIIAPRQGRLPKFWDYYDSEEES